MRHVALTVLAVNPAMASPWTGNPLTVPNDAETVRQVREAAHEAIAKAAADVGEAQPVSVAVTAFSGFPAQALIEASRSADLIVIGSRGLRGLKSKLLGSTSAHVLHHALRPVVVVRHPDDHSAQA